MLVFKGLLLFSLLVIVDSWCTPFSYGEWHQWESCSSSCGGGTHRRVRYACVKSDENWETGNCNELCHNGGSYYSGRCHCTSRSYGRCCEECPTIARCADSHCTSRTNTKCERCEDNGILFQPTPDKTKCERNCAWDKLNCWPGTCDDGLIHKCNCATGFHKFSGPGETSCQLDGNNAPLVHKCFIVITGQYGERKQTQDSECTTVNDFYGNFQPHDLQFDLVTDFKIDISNVTKPAFIKETEFGITDVTLYVLMELVSGIQHEINSIQLLQNASNGLNATETYSKNDTVRLDRLNIALKDGERLCIQFEAFGGGYLKAKDLRTNTVLRPVPFQKTRTIEMTCYKYDCTKPHHCLQTNSCPSWITEPLSVDNRISKSPSIQLKFDGWIDPIPPGGNQDHASGIDGYELFVHEVNNGVVDETIAYHSLTNATQTSAMLNLGSDHPRLYCIVLKVKDAADNIQQARRFVLYDNSSFISSRKDKVFVITSASTKTNFMWQTNNDELCLDWKDHFYNQFYLDNNVLGRIKADPNGYISGIYEQRSGVLPVTGTPNVNGITAFMFSWSQSNSQFSNEVFVPNFENQTYCQRFYTSDGESYTFNIRAVDIVNNSYSENRTVHIDRTPPIIIMLGLSVSGNKSILVYNDTDLSKLPLRFKAMDPHSGIKFITWTFGLPDTSIVLTSGALAVGESGTVTCNNNSTCYCPDVGECETLLYTVSLSGLVASNRHMGINNRTYWLTVNVTNNAMLFHTEIVEILIDICSSSPAIMNCVDKSCTPDSYLVCDTCDPGYSAVEGNTSCFDMTTNHDYVCNPMEKDHCYIIFRVSHTWLDAKHICSMRKGNLFVPGNMEEELFLEKYLTAVKDILQYSQMQFWIGGRIQARNEFWVNYKDNRLNRWAVQHSNEIDTVCAAMDSQHNFMWNSFSCDHRAFFICKEKAPYHTPQQPPLVG